MEPAIESTVYAHSHTGHTNGLFRVDHEMGFEPNLNGIWQTLGGGGGDHGAEGINALSFVRIAR